MHTQDVAEANIEKIGQLFPNCLTERIVGKDKDGKDIVDKAIDFDKLKQELSKEIVEGNQERYQFTWPGKREAMRLANTPTNMTLRPDRESSVDFDNTENLYIEGDNLEVLKLLRENYLGKVKMIYIDPPYNTGSDFVYEDDYSETSGEFKDKSGMFDESGNMLLQNYEVNADSNGRFHTDWLNMLYTRLKVSKDLLTEDGVILINMDENEITNLQKICSEIFGEHNDLGTIIWDKRNPKGDARGISYQHEYIIVYAKNKLFLTDSCKIQRPKKNAEQMIKKAKQLFSKISDIYTLDSVNKDFASWLSKQDGISGGEAAYCKIDENGDLYRPVSMAWPNKKQAPEDYFIPLIHPVTNKPCAVPDRGWRNPSTTMKQLFEQGLILFGKDENTIPNRKYLLKDNLTENIPSLIYYGGSDVDILESMDIPFETPKVVSICQEHIKSFSNPGDIILDYFSGSATNAHAIMKLNSEGEGNRHYIMVQLPEKIDEKSIAYKKGFQNLCQMGQARIKKSRDLILQESRLFATEADLGFRVLKLDTSNMQDVYYKPEDFSENTLFEDNVKPDRTSEDLLFQVMLECNLPLSAKIEKKTIAGKEVFNVNDGYLLACFDKDVNETVITEVAKQKPYYFIMRDKSLSSDNVADNFEQIFNAYSKDTIRRIL